MSIVVSFLDFNSVFVIMYLLFSGVTHMWVALEYLIFIHQRRRQIKINEQLFVETEK